MAYYFCLNHRAVEGEDGCKGKDRLGPYDTYAAAQHALETAAQRTKEWDEDPVWNDDVDPDD